MAEPKTKRTKASVSAFLNTIEEPQKRADAKAIAKLMQEVSGEKPYMMGAAIVGFGSYKASSGFWPIMGFSPRKANLVLYIMSGFAGRDALLGKLGKHKTGKGCLYLNKLADIDQNALRDLIAKSVQWMRENHECE